VSKGGRVGREGDKSRALGVETVCKDITIRGTSQGIGRKAEKRVDITDRHSHANDEPGAEERRKERNHAINQEGAIRLSEEGSRW